MLNSITWSQFLISLTILVTVYYLSVIVFYYRITLATFISKRVNSIESINRADNTRDLIDVTAKLARDIESKTIEASKKGIIKEEMLYSIRMIILEYPNLKGTPFQIAINNQIEHHCEKECSIHLSAEELRGLWES